MADPTPDPAPTPGPTTDPAPTPGPAPASDPAASEPPKDDPAAMAAALKKANAQAAKDRFDAQAARDELAKLQAAHLSDQEKAILEARTTATTEAEQKWRDRFLDAKVRAEAAGKGVNPSLMLKLIDRAALKWDGDELDEASLNEAIDALIAEHPNLVAGSPTAPRVPAGPRNTAPPITAEQLKTMTPEQIESAHSKGELNHLLKA